MRRLVFFGDSNSPVSSLLLEKTIQASSGRDDISLVAVCDAGKSPPRRPIVRTAEHLLGFYVRRFFEADYRRSREALVLPSMERFCRRSGISLLRPPGRNINQPEFIRMLQDRVQPHLALSCYCPQIFSPRLLALFQSAVNYHNGLLPEYRGLYTTAWAMYLREAKTGLTFHYMTDQIDRGRMLIRETFPMAPGRSRRAIEIHKAQLAQSCLSRLLELWLSGERGTEPVGEGRYFSRKDWKELVHISDPSRLTARELLHRLACFELVDIRIGTVSYPVSKLVRANRVGRLAFRTSDGVILKPTRFRYLPYPLYRLYAFLRSI